MHFRKHERMENMGSLEGWHPENKHIEKIGMKNMKIRERHPYVHAGNMSRA